MTVRELLDLLVGPQHIKIFYGSRSDLNTITFLGNYISEGGLLSPYRCSLKNMPKNIEQEVLNYKINNIEPFNGNYSTNYEVGLIIYVS